VTNAWVTVAGGLLRSFGPRRDRLTAKGSSFGWGLFLFTYVISGRQRLQILPIYGVREVERTQPIEESGVKMKAPKLTFETPPDLDKSFKGQLRQILNTLSKTPGRWGKLGAWATRHYNRLSTDAYHLRKDFPAARIIIRKIDNEATMYALFSAAAARRLAPKPARKAKNTKKPIRLTTKQRATRDAKTDTGA
jgi:hypothetical protein